MRYWLAAALMGLSGAALADCAPDRVTLRGDWGTAAFTVEIADTPEERGIGLMHRDSLSSTAGMLFVYERPQDMAFWMRNTLIPLDMVFIDANGVVQRVHENAIPLDETPIPAGSPILAVLEINGGLARLIGISKGSEVQHAAFGAAANWPCDSF